VYTLLAFANLVPDNLVDGYDENVVIVHPVDDPHALYVMSISLFRNTFTRCQREEEIKPLKKKRGMPKLLLTYHRG